VWPFLRTEAEHVPVRADLLGAASGVALRTWEPADAVAYAAGIGATRDEGPPSTLITLLAQFDVEFPAALGPWAFARVLHAEQSHTTYAPVPLRGRLSIRTRVSDLRDLATGVIVGISAEALDGDDGTLVARTRMGLFVRGDRSGATSASARRSGLPERPAEHTVVDRPAPTRPNGTLAAATTIRCTSKPRRPGPAVSLGRSCTGCARTASPVGRSSRCCARTARSGWWP